MSGANGLLKCPAGTPCCSSITVDRYVFSYPTTHYLFTNLLTNWNRKSTRSWSPQLKSRLCRSQSRSWSVSFSTLAEWRRRWWRLSWTWKRCHWGKSAGIKCWMRTRRWVTAPPSSWKPRMGTRMLATLSATWPTGFTHSSHTTLGPRYHHCSITMSSLRYKQ